MKTRRRRRIIGRGGVLDGEQGKDRDERTVEVKRRDGERREGEAFISC